MTTNLNIVAIVNAVESAFRTVVSFVTVNELRDILWCRRGSAFASIDATFDMDPKMYVKANPFYGKGVKKFSKTNVLVTFDYEKMVEKREGEFSGKGNWEQAVIRDDGSLTPLTVNRKDVQSVNPFVLANPNAKVYLRCESRKSESRFLDANGNEIRYDEIKPYIKPTNSKNDTNVNFRTIGLSNVTEMRIDGMVYRIRESVAQAA